MKKYTLFTLLILGSLVLFTFLQKEKTTVKPKEVASVEINMLEEESEQKAPNHKLEFNDHFFGLRAYPDKVFDFKAYMKALDNVYQETKVATKSVADFDKTWRQEGPNNIGGRINAIAIDPTDDDIMYAGAASGGVFKTTDGGTNWEPIFDDQPFLTIGTIEIDPTNNNTIYVGTGDVNIGGYVAVGDGLYRSTDAGATWEHLGLTNQRIISKVKIDYNNPSTIYVGTMGMPFERNEERGLYKSTDNGATWEKILYVSDEAGVIDLIMDHSNPEVLYAAFWNRIRNNTESMSFGQDARIWKTADGGTTWEMLEGGLPMGEQSRIGLAMSATNSEKLYAFYVDTTHFTQGMYQSLNGGTTWNALNTDILKEETAVGGFGWYFSVIGVNPENDEHVYVLGVDLWDSQDMGNNWERTAPIWWTYEVHADKHALAFVDGNTFVIGTDGGMYKTTDGGASWTDIENLPNTQIYRVANNPHIVGGGEYTVGCQDNGTTTGNYQTPNWPRLYGGDGFQPIHNPDASNIMYAETQNGGLVVSTNEGGSFDDFTFGINGEDRRSWDMPFIMSPHNSNTLYTGTHKVYRATQGPSSTWQTVSESLTDEPESDDDNRYHVITALDESPVVEGRVYVGAVDAKVWVAADIDNGVWTDISAGLPERYVTSIKGSPTDANTVYVTHSGYKDNDNIAHVHKSTDNGATWVDLSGNLPDIACNDIFIIPEHNDSILFVGTDAGVYGTIDGGVTWDRLGNNMPMFQIFDLAIDLEDKRLIAATFARSLWTYDLMSVLGGEIIDVNDPIITVLNEEITILVGEEFVPPTATATDNVDGDLTDLIEINYNGFNANEAGIYTIFYTVTDAAGNTATVPVTVIVEIDDIPPTFSYTADTLIFVAGDEFVPHDVTASNPIDGDLTSLIEIDDSDVDMTIAGIYEVIYTIVDATGTETSITLYVLVENPETSINTLALNSEWRIYPNPTTDYLNIDFSESLQNQIKEIRVVDATGRILQMVEAMPVVVRELPVGLYGVQVILVDGVVVQQSFVKR